MAIQIITSKIGDSCTTEDINRLHLEMSRKRIFTMTAPNQIINLHCLTDDATGLHEDIKVIDYVENESITDVRFNMLQFMDTTNGFDPHDKIVLWDAMLHPLDLCQTRVIAGFPPAGDHREALDFIPDMDLELGMKIKNEMLPFLQLVTKWWNTEELGYEDWYVSFNGSDCSHLCRAFEEDPVAAQSTSFAEFLSTNFKGVLLPTEPGAFSPYYVGNKEKTDELNTQWETNVRPYFPDAWTGHGGEEEAPFLEWNHEYRDVSKQVKFLYLDNTENKMNPKDDWYLLLWFL